MNRKEQNKILDAKIEYKIDLNYKPNALDKARFEFFH